MQLDFQQNLKRYGKYYYCEESLKPNEIIKIFDGIVIPTNLSKKYENSVIELRISAEAVQQKNFTPDYTLGDPWEGIVPEKSTDTEYDINTGDGTITIKYENGTEYEISIKNNFFKNLKGVMPGDVYEDSIEIKNNNDKNVKYYLKYEANEGNEKEKELLNLLNLTITNDKGQVVYNGKIADLDYLFLGEYDIDEIGKLSVKLSAPLELSNDYQNIAPKFNLIFSSDYESEDANRGTAENRKNPKTGDSVDLAITIFFASAIGLIVVMLLVYIEKKKEDIDKSIY